MKMIAMLSLFAGLNAQANALDGKKFKVVSKKCGESVLSVNTIFPDVYQFASGFLAVITLSEDSEVRQCKQVVGYKRVLTSFSTADSYEEASTLQQAVLRTVCRNKVEGKLEEKVSLDETKQVDSEKYLGLLVDEKVDDIINARIAGSSECAEDLLHLQLSEIKK